MKKILITGGSGLVGDSLTRKLLDKGYKVSHLSRTEGTDFPDVDGYLWNPKKGEIDDNAVKDVDFIVHLAGTNLASGRWTEKRKKLLASSRIDTAHMLFDAVERQNTRLSGFISASGINYYGAVTSDHIFSEEDPAGDDFLGQLCIGWEAAADRFSSRCRVVKLRTSMVLDKDEGALPELARPVSMGAGSPLGSGKQWTPWIHIDDISRMYLHTIENEVSGAFNAAAPQHMNNAEMTETLARVLKKPYWAPRVPSFAIRLVFGEMANILLHGSRASTDKIRESGFAFSHPELEGALNDLYDIQ